MKQTAAVLLGLALLAVSSAAQAGLPDTGQAKCYNDTVEIACPSPGADFYGQDAQYRKPRSYTDLGNGIIRDNVSGLMWQKATAPGTYTWDGAIAYCTGLHLGPYTDWRLPTIKELTTLVDSNIPYPGPTINTVYFPDTVASYYWSSTTDADYSSYAWYVYFSYGGIGSYSKSYLYYVRAVRSGQY